MTFNDVRVGSSFATNCPEDLFSTHHQFQRVNVLKAPTKEQHKGCCHTVGISDDCIEMWYYNNLLIEVFRIRDPSSDLKVEWVSNYSIPTNLSAQEAIRARFLKVCLMRRVVGVHESIRIHDEFEITVKVAEGAYLPNARFLRTRRKTTILGSLPTLPLGLVARKLFSPVSTKKHFRRIREAYRCRFLPGQLPSHSKSILMGKFDNVWAL
ncbi:hypothetical protein BDZ97DRAFT_1316807 [Flammula alnicola]|nr:hypothetical protein BDZ97DRAFT_1316807 [Flammula alnicola]